MTENEKLIKNEQEAIETIKKNMPISGYQMLRESLDMAIKALEEVQELKERDTAKKPIKTKGLKDFNGNIYKVVGECPNCGCGVSNRMRFCDECGQRLDWSE